MPEPSDQERVQFVEELARLFARDGMPMIRGRIIGWLMVCDPPEQTPAQIGAAIRASKGSISTNLQLLTAAGFVRATTRTGDRSTYYLVEDEAWLEITRRRLESLSALREVLGKGVRLLGEDSPQSGRLKDARALFSWLEGELKPLWPRWEQYRDSSTNG